VIEFLETYYSLQQLSGSKGVEKRKELNSGLVPTYWSQSTLTQNFEGINSVKHI
jgi:hypothetical protein